MPNDPSLLAILRMRYNSLKFALHAQGVTDVNLKAYQHLKTTSRKPTPENYVAALEEILTTLKYISDANANGIEDWERIKADLMADKRLDWASDIDPTE